MTSVLLKVIFQIIAKTIRECLHKILFAAMTKTINGTTKNEKKQYNMQTKRNVLVGTRERNKHIPDQVVLVSSSTQQL